MEDESRPQRLLTALGSPVQQLRSFAMLTDDVPVPAELFERTLSVSIPEYGVLLYAGHSKVYLYKHARREPR
jgi:hypothetical protein